MPPTMLTPALPSEAESTLARKASRILASQLRNSDPLQLRILGDSRSGGTLKLPAQAVRLLVRIVEEMGRGNAVTLIPVHAELTTQEAADMLNISRPSMIQLLNDNKLPYRRVGTHRRIRLEDLLAYKRRADNERRAALEELAAYDQEIGI